MVVHRFNYKRVHSKRVYFPLFRPNKRCLCREWGKEKKEIVYILIPKWKAMEIKNALTVWYFFFLSSFRLHYMLNHIALTRCFVCDNVTHFLSHSHQKAVIVTTISSIKYLLRNSFARYCSIWITRILNKRFDGWHRMWFNVNVKRYDDTRTKLQISHTFTFQIKFYPLNRYSDGYFELRFLRSMSPNDHPIISITCNSLKSIYSILRPICN